MTVTPSLRSHRGLVVSVLLVTVASRAYEIVPASTTPVLATALDVPAAQVSWLVSVMLGIAVIASLPSGIVVDRFGTKVSFTVAAVLFFEQ